LSSDEQKCVLLIVILISCAVGVGHNGLELAAHLKVLGTSSLQIIKEDRLRGKLICFTCTHTHILTTLETTGLYMYFPDLILWARNISEIQTYFCC
jgi:hypothetical protein